MSSSPDSFQNAFDSYKARQELDSPFLNEEYLVEEARTAQTWRNPVPGFQIESPFLEAFEEGWGAISEKEEVVEEYDESLDELGEKEFEKEDYWLEASDFHVNDDEAPNDQMRSDMEDSIKELYDGDESPYFQRQALLKNAISWEEEPLISEEVLRELEEEETAPTSGLRQRIVEIAKQEWHNWEQGKLPETGSKAKPLLRKYWMNYRPKGLSQSQADKRIEENTAWSAVFICYVMREAGAGNAFTYSSLHTTYIAAAKKAIEKQDPSKFQAYDISDVRPEVGDLICRDRAPKLGAPCAGTNFANVDRGGISHSDIVVEVRARYIVILGGNTAQTYPHKGKQQNTVGQRKIELDEQGFVIPDQSKCKYFAIVKSPNGGGIVPSGTGATKPSVELVHFAQRVLNTTESERLDDDGDLGGLTRSALERFRRKYNLGAGGVLDNKTQLALAQRALEEIAQQSIFPQFGVLDAKTEQALIAFKSKRGLGFNATLDAATRVALTDALAKRIGTAKPTVPSATPTGFPKLGKSFTPPSDPTAYRRFRLTTYHVASEPITSSDPLVPVLTSSGNVIARVPAGFFTEMALEGRGRLKDGRLLTGDDWQSSSKHDYSPVLAIHYQRFPPKNKYHDKTKVSGIAVVDGKVVSVRAYAVVPKSKAGQGYGILRGIPLEPYRTVAADIGAFENSEKRYRGVPSRKKGRYVVVNGKTGLVPTGTQVYIRQLDGVTLPNGKRHDGWVIVNDTGGGIFGAHFDVFVDEKQNGEPFIKMVGGKLVDVWFDGIEQRIPSGYSYGLKP